MPLQWRHNGRDCVSNHQPHDCLLNRLFRRRSKKTSKRRVTGLCAGNSPGTGEFPAQMASNVENVPIWWRHHDDIIINHLMSLGIFIANRTWCLFMLPSIVFTIKVDTDIIFFLTASSKGSINLYAGEAMLDTFMKNVDCSSGGNGRRVFVFYCAFSSQRKVSPYPVHGPRS